MTKIKEIKPKGPYLLGGHSYGGIVAYEIAKQLTGKHEQVAWVALLDSWAAFADVFRNKQLFTKIMERQQQTLQNQITTKIAISDQKAWLDLQWKRMQSLYDYNPVKTKLNVTLFKAEELLPENKDLDDPYNHWKKYLNDLDVNIVPGNHDTMLLMPHIETLAAKLQIYLDKFE